MEKCDQLENLVGGHSSAERSTAFSPRLLIIDCETRRFTIEGPIAKDCLNAWYSEADHALMAGRAIFCVPISDMGIDEIAALGAELGYDHWPPNTIIVPAKNWNKEPSGNLLPSRGRGFESRVKLLNRNRSDWLDGLRRASPQQARAS